MHGPTSSKIFLSRYKKLNFQFLYIAYYNLAGVISTPIVVISVPFGAEITINGVRCIPTFDISAPILRK